MAAHPYPLWCYTEVEKHPERLTRYGNVDEMFEDWGADVEEC